MNTTQYSPEQKALFNLWFGSISSNFFRYSLLENPDKIRFAISSLFEPPLDSQSKNPTLDACEKAYALLSAPSPTLKQLICDKNEYKFTKNFLPFFAWVAFQKKSELFKNELFILLVSAYIDDAACSLDTAVLFNNKKYIQNILPLIQQYHPTPLKCFYLAINIACESDCTSILRTLIDTLKQMEIDLNNINANVPVYFPAPFVKITSMR